MCLPVLRTGLPPLCMIDPSWIWNGRRSGLWRRKSRLSGPRGSGCTGARGLRRSSTRATAAAPDVASTEVETARPERRAIRRRHVGGDGPHQDFRKRSCIHSRPCRCSRRCRSGSSRNCSSTSLRAGSSRNYTSHTRMRTESPSRAGLPNDESSPTAIGNPKVRVHGAGSPGVKRLPSCPSTGPFPIVWPTSL